MQKHTLLKFRVESTRHLAVDLGDDRAVTVKCDDMRHNVLTYFELRIRKLCGGLASPS